MRQSRRGEPRHLRGGSALAVGLALALGGVLIAPAPPAGAYPYGVYQVVSRANGRCLTVPGNGGPGTFLILATCNGGANQNWHFDRIGTYDGDPVFEIRATHRISGGIYTDCLDLPWADVQNGQPLWTQPCRPNNPAQQWRQTYHAPPGGEGYSAFTYSSMVSPNWMNIQANNNDTYPHLVMVESQWLGHWPDIPRHTGYQDFNQRYVGP